MDFFYNPNIALTIVEKVPCAFAPAKDDGSYGAHYVCAMFDEDNNVVFIESQCEAKHGEDVISTMEEMGGRTCYAYLAALKKVLSNSTSDDLHGLGDSLALRQQLVNVSRIVDQTRSRRNHLKAECEASTERAYGEGVHAAILTNIARTVSDCPLFSIRSRRREGDAVFTFVVDGRFIAERTHTGLWQISSQWVQEPGQNKVWLSPYYAENFCEHDSEVNTQKRGESVCCVCHKSFSRISKHAKSEAHQKNLTVLINRALKFTHGAGLQAVMRRGPGSAWRFKPEGRSTVGKRNLHKQRLQNYARTFETEPRKNELAMYNGELGFKHLALQRYCARTGLYMTLAKEIFEHINATGAKVSV